MVGIALYKNHHAIFSIFFTRYYITFENKVTINHCYYDCKKLEIKL